MIYGAALQALRVLFGEVPRPLAWAGMFRALGPWGGNAAGPSVEMVLAESSRSDFAKMTQPFQGWLW